MMLSVVRRIYLDAYANQFCIVDADDYDWLIVNMWNVGRRGKRNGLSSKDYAKRNIGTTRTTIWMHRAILLRHQPLEPGADLVGDHKNRQTLDNRKCNLRWLTQTENNRNGTGHKYVCPSLEYILATFCVEDIGLDVPFT
jgi:hypothetical protein